MAYRNGTYVAFHANGTKEPTESDMKYYNLLRAWKANEAGGFSFINSHEKTAAVKDTSSKETLRTRLRERLNNSKNMVLIIGNTTREDKDWVPFEIAHAIDVCKLPIIAAYPCYSRILAPVQLRVLWPFALASRIDQGSAHVIHVPFAKIPLSDAIGQFTYEHYPNGGGLGIYSAETYERWGVA